MAVKTTYQVLRDTTTDAVIKITGTFTDTTQEQNNTRIQANTLYGALATNGFLVANNLGGAANTALSYYDLQLTGMKSYVNFSTAGTGAVEIFWNGGGSSAANQYANSATIFHLNSVADFGLTDQYPSITNNTTGGNGDLGVYTTGAVAGSAYTIVLQFRKNNQMYQRGQFNDPAAFNYGSYSLGR